MSKGSRKTANRSEANETRPEMASISRNKLIAWLVIIAVSIVGIFLWRSGLFEHRSAAPITAFGMGNVLYCQGTPPFIRAIGYNQAGAFDTRAQVVRGIALHEMDTDGNILRTYEHPSWSSAGYLGSYQRDEAGNLYAIAMPFISILENPPDKANIIYRIDGATGEMAPYIELPAAAPLNPENVYGLLDITYDCDTNSLYVSSVEGSSYNRVAGRIFQIDVESGEVAAVLDNLDAFGLAVFNGSSGKRLYFGLARVPEIYSIALDNNGHFTGELRLEIPLQGMGFHRDERARSLTFQGGDRLVVELLQFDFNLVAPTEIRKTLLGYAYVAEADGWQLLGAEVTGG